MGMLVAATAVFLLTHFVTSTPIRPVLVKALGERPYQGLYSLVALAAIAWMAHAYGNAPREPLWTGLRFLPVLVMPAAFVLLICGYSRNPTMIGADRLLASQDPARGMIRITRHPIMWALMLWSGAHVLARGDSSSVIFFGSFLLLAGAGTLAMDSRKKSNPEWARFEAVTSNLPFVAIAQGRNRIVWAEIGWLRPLVGLALFAAFFAAHQWLFGVRPV
jgi:uncharacterized membrane protein